MVSPSRTLRAPGEVARAFSHLRSLGMRDAAGLVGEQLWYTKSFFGLAASLQTLPVTRPAKIPVVMRSTDPATFDGFDRELHDATGADYAQLLLRQGLCRAGITELYVAENPDGDAIYTQWLTRAQGQEQLHAHAPGRYPTLSEDEVLLEGAYTFSRFRQLGAMRDGMSQLLQIARDEGKTIAFTYVETHNVPSLRGCADVGFRTDHMRGSIRRLGRRRGFRRPVNEDDLSLWQQATA